MVYLRVRQGLPQQAILHFPSWLLIWHFHSALHLVRCALGMENISAFDILASMATDVEHLDGDVEHLDDTAPYGPATEKENRRKGLDRFTPLSWAARYPCNSDQAWSMHMGHRHGLAKPKPTPKP